MTVAAQHGRGAGKSRVIIVSPSIGFGYSPYYGSAFGYSPFGYSPFGSPYGYNNSYNRPSRLDMKVSDIKADYKDKIKSARHDESISRDERKKIVAQLKSERDKSIHDLKANYYKQKTVATTAPEDKG
jgi:hypothetical protein